jgi:hypothetical protein
MVVSLMLVCGLALAAQPTALNANQATISRAGAQSLLRPGEQMLAKTLPPRDPAEETLHVDGDQNDAIGFGGAMVWYSAVRLTTVRACTLTAVIYYQYDASLDDYLYVWAAGTSTEPGAILESVPYTATNSMSWQRVDLPMPIPLASGVDFWCGPRMNEDASTGWPLGCDAGPAIDQVGDWFNYQAVWEEIQDYSLDYNWSIRAILGSGTMPAHDVGANAVLAPTGIVIPSALTPRAQIFNYGTSAESDIPVTCWIDSAGTRVYDHTATYTGPLASGAQVQVDFTPVWLGVNGNTYSVRMFTGLVGDENNANDTARATVTVTAAVWESIPPPPDSLDRVVHATVYDPVGDKIYMIGGNAAGVSATYQNSNQQFDPATGTWAASRMAAMPTPCGWITGSYCRGKIYIIGGHDNSGAALATNQCYDIAGNSWSTVAARPRVGVADMEVTWNDSLIYVMGGNNLSAGMTNVDIYNPFTNAWSVGTALPQATYMGSATIIGDTIFVVQAYTGSACWPNLYKGAIDPATPTTITWTTGPAPSEVVFNGGTAAMDGDVYWLGGFVAATTVTNHVWKYSTSSGAITAFTPNYPVTLSRCNFMVARPVAHELYVMAGDMAGDWAAPNRKYYKISLGPNAVEEGKLVVGGTIDNAAPSLVRNFARISYTLNHRASVSLGVYNASGSLVRTLANGTFDAGTRNVTWDRTGSNGRRVANGTYFYRLTIDGKSVSNKAIVLN